MFVFAFFFISLHILNETQKSWSEFESFISFFYPITVVAFLEISQVSKHFSPKSHTWRIQIFLSSYFHCMSLPCVETTLGVGLNYIANLSGCDQCIYSLFIFHIQVLCKLVWFRVTFQLLYCHSHNVDDSVISLGTFDRL